MNRSRREISPILAFTALLFISFPSSNRAQNAAPAQTAAPAPVIVAKFDKNLSTKNAKVDDPVVAKALKAFKLLDGTDIPKGSKLTGKVATVQSKKAGNGDSMLTFRFDQVEVKGGAPIPIHGLVVAIGPEMAPKDDLGPHSVLSRSSSVSGDTSNAGRGVGSTNGLDPSKGMSGVAPKDEDDIAMGSTMAGVALGRHLDADWTTILKGIKTDIDLDSTIVVKVQLK
jgi:hypothetical protein